jgi:hypothetical protein
MLTGCDLDKPETSEANPKLCSGSPAGSLRPSPLLVCSASASASAARGSAAGASESRGEEGREGGGGQQMAQP